jgi:transposase IS4-like protein/DDE family transposase
MLSTKISMWVGASLSAYCGTAGPLAGAPVAQPLAGEVLTGTLTETLTGTLTGTLTEVLTGIADRGLVDVAIDKAGRRQRRDRALPAWVVVYLVFGLCLFTAEGYGSVLRQLWPSLTRMRGRRVEIPDASALSKARQRLGAELFETLFDELRHPVATAHTPGAFRFGLRLVSIDGTSLDVPDSADNDAVFDRYAGSQGPARTPQIRLTMLLECATHAVLAARFDGTQTSEQVMADHLIDDLQPGMLLLADRNFFSFQRWHDAAATGAHLLWRLRRGTGQGTPHLPVLKVLPDGSYLSRLRESAPARRLRSNHTCAGTRLHPRHPDIPVRVIDFTITVTTDAGRRREAYRLLTTILDPDHAPAAELAACYHERWESETGYGHLKTRLRGPRTVLRSRHPDTIRQEIWAYLCVYQTLCRLATNTAQHAAIDPDRISFTVTLRELRRSLTNPTDHPPHHITEAILNQRLPQRRNRISDRGPKPKHGRPPRSRKATFHITVKPHPTAQTP